MVWDSSEDLLVQALTEKPTEDDIADTVDEVMYVNETLYDELSKESLRARSRIGRSDADARPGAELFLFREARLLDDRRYDEWLALFAKDCIYWVPAEPNPVDPRTESSVNFDDHRRLADRIALIGTGYLHAQTPPSRTVRVVTNVEAWPSDDGGLETSSSIVIWEYRRKRMTTYVGRQHHVLVPDGSDWRIRHKTIYLIDSDAPIGNLTFIL